MPASSSEKLMIVMSVVFSLITIIIVAFFFLNPLAPLVPPQPPDDTNAGQQFNVDLIVAESGITFTPASPEEGEEVSIDVTVSNFGTSDAGSATVQLFDGSPGEDGVKIHEQEVSIPAAGEETVSATWTATFGVHRFHVLVDESNAVEESNEENNEAVKAMRVDLSIVNSATIEEAEFLEETTPETNELLEYARELGYEVVSIEEIEYAGGKSSHIATLASEGKPLFLVKFYGEGISNEPFLMSKEDNVLTLYDKNGSVEIDFANLDFTSSAEYHSCDKWHCIGSCFVYYVSEDPIWSELCDEFQDQCIEALITGSLEEKAGWCTALVSCYAGAGLGCSTWCWHTEWCGWCKSDHCGSSGWLDEPFCYEGDVMQHRADYTCSNPGTTSSYCNVAFSYPIKYICGRTYEDEWQEYCSENKVFRKRTVHEYGCKDAECYSKEYEETELVEDCSEKECGETIGVYAICDDYGPGFICNCIDCQTDAECPEDSYLPEQRTCDGAKKIKITKTFRDYYCAGNNFCHWKPPTETIEYEYCKEDEYGSGYWTCQDIKTRAYVQDVTQYTCQSGLCRTSQTQLTTKTEPCGDDYCTWNDWECYDTDTRTRSGLCNHLTCQEGVCTATSTDEIEFGECLDERCVNGECTTEEKYALIVGENGTVLKYDGTIFTQLSSGVSNDLFDVAWKPDGSYALIVGSQGLVMKYDGVGFTMLQLGGLATQSALKDVAWRPNGDYAVILGPTDIIKYDSTNFSSLKSAATVVAVWSPNSDTALFKESGTTVLEYSAGSFRDHTIDPSYTSIQDADWKPNGGYALFVGMGGTVVKYDGSSFSYEWEPTYDWLMSVAWKPDSSFALIGGWNLIKYDGTNYTNLTSDLRENYNDIAWKPDGSYALVVGVADPLGPSARSVVLTSDGSTFTDISGGLPTSNSLEAVAWKP